MSVRLNFLIQCMKIATCKQRREGLIWFNLVLVLSLVGLLPLVFQIDMHRQEFITVFPKFSFKTLLLPGRKVCFRNMFPCLATDKPLEKVRRLEGSIF